MATITTRSGKGSPLTNDEVDANFTNINTELGEKLPKAGGTVTGNIVMGGSETVDGRDVSVDGTKLDGIEAGATADQTDAEIKTAYENNSDTNAYTDAEKTKLGAVETGATADQTAAEIKTAYESSNDTNAFTDTEKTKLGNIEASATADQTDTEIKTAYENNSNTNAFTDAEKTKLGNVAASANNYSLPTAAAGTLGGIKIGTGLSIDSSGVVTASAASNLTDAEVKTAYENNSNTNAFTDAEKTKLTGIETGATADQTAAEIEAIANHDNLQGFVANEHIDWTTSGAGTIHATNYTDTNTTYSVGDGGLTQKNFTTALNNKLTGVEASATADQTAAEIEAAVSHDNLQGVDANQHIDWTASGAGTIHSSNYTDTNTTYSVGDGGLTQKNFTTGLNTKLAGIEDNAKDDQTAAEIEAVVNHDNLQGFVANEHIDWSSSGTGTLHVSHVVNALTAGTNITINTDGTINSTGGGSSSGDPNQNAFSNFAVSGQTTIAADQTTDTVTIVGGANVTVTTNASTDTITFTSTDTTYTVGDGGLTQKNFTTALNTKLAGVETGATADQTAGEIEAIVNHDNLQGFVANEHIDWTASSAGTIHASNYTDTDTTYTVGDGGLTQKNFTTALNTKLAGIEASATADQTDAEIKAAYENNSDTNAYTDAEKTKLAGVETAATADQTKADIDALNINADLLDGQHGAYYTAYADSAVSNLVDSAPAALNSLNELASALGDDSNFATTVTNNLATKLPLAGGTMTGNIVMSGTETVDGRDLSADGAKLDGIETAATADQTDAEIKSAYENNGNTNAYTDAEKIKLAGVESNAKDDQTASEIEAIVSHDNLQGVSANQHIDWTASGAGTIHASNYTDTDTTYSVGDGGLTQKNFTTALNTKLSNIEDNAKDDQTASEIEAIVNHDNLQGFVANEHIDWTVSGAGTINADNYAATTQSGTQIEAIVNHDNLLGVSADQHVNWTVSQADYSGVVSTLFSSTNSMYVDFDNTTTQNRRGPVQYIDKTSISVTSTYLEFYGYGLYLPQASAYSYIRYINRLNFTGSAGTITESGNVSYNIVSSSVQIPSSWLHMGTEADRLEFQGLVNTALSGNSNFEGWLTDGPYRVEEAPSTYSGYAKKFTVVDKALAGTNYTASTSGVHDDYTVTNSFNAGSNVQVGNWLENHHFVLGNQWLITSASEQGGYGRMTISRFDPNDSLKAAASVPLHADNYTSSTYSVGDGGLTEKNFTAALNTKLAGIETSATADQTAGEIEAIVTHDNLQGVSANQHIDWTASGAGTIHSSNYTDTNTTYSVGDGGLTQKNFTTALNTKLAGVETNATADQTAGEIEAIVNHDNLQGFVANEHIDWSASGAGTIHSSNYTDTNTTYSVGDGGLTEKNFTTALNTKLAGVETGATANGYQEITITASGGAFYVDGAIRHTLTLLPSVTYRLDQSASSNSSHPLRLSTTSNGTHASGSAYTTGVTVVGTAGSSGAYVQVQLEQDAPSLFYYCGNHSNMGGSVSQGGTSYSVGDGGLTQNNFTNADHTKLDGIAASANNFVLPTAAAGTLGGVKVGANLSIDGSGVLSASAGSSYSLPAATASALGGIKIGTGLSIDGSGVVTASGASASGGTLNPVKQTEFTGSATNTFSVTYQAGNISVFLNGAKLAAADIAAATNGTSVQLASAVAASDVVTVVEYGAPFAANYASNIYTATAGQTTQAVTVTPDKCAVYVNGVKILLTTDYSVNAAGTTITFVNALAAGDMIEVVEHGALATLPSGAATSYSNLAAFPSSGNTHGDIAYAQDTKVAYMWLDTSWQRMAIGPQIGPRITTEPPAAHSLQSDGSTSTITIAAVDESGFPITYDWDAVQGSTVYNAASLPTALTSVSESNGVFTLTPSTNTSHATTTLKFRAKASDGVLFTPAITTISLSFLNYMAATGGTVTTVGNYKIHVFNSSGNFSISSAGVGQSEAGIVQYLIVAGGGGGGGGQRGAGGGAGGLLTGSSTGVAAGAFSVVVGAGGAGGIYNTNPATINIGTQGGNSSFNSLTAIGGGYGAAADSNAAGGNGGSGGGGWYSSSAGGNGTSGQGNNGGSGGTSPPYGGGGGGAGAVGSSFAAGQTGGVGLQNSITGSSVYYAGGGSASNYDANSNVAGGLGGGGIGHNASGTHASANGTANTGGGGGSSGSGGSGVVILKYRFQA